MRLTACMFFFDEHPNELYSQVTALEGFADRLVAVHGRWDGFPVPEQDTSHVELVAVMEAAHTAGIDLTLHRTSSTFAGELAQRNYTLQLALTDADWVFLMDADERLIHYGPNVRDDLASMAEDVATVEFVTAEGPEQPLTQWEKPGETTEQRRLFRALASLRFETHHWWLRTDTKALWGEVAGLEFAKARKLAVTVEHRTCLRSPERWAVKRQFAAVRDPADRARGYEL